MLDLMEQPITEPVHFIWPDDEVNLLYADPEDGAQGDHEVEDDDCEAPRVDMSKLPCGTCVLVRTPADSETLIQIGEIKRHMPRHLCQEDGKYYPAFRCLWYVCRNTSDLGDIEKELKAKRQPARRGARCRHRSHTLRARTAYYRH